MSESSSLLDNRSTRYAFMTSIHKPIVGWRRNAFAILVHSLLNFKSAWNVRCNYLTAVCKYRLCLLSRFTVKGFFYSIARLKLKYELPYLLFFPFFQYIVGTLRRTLRMTYQEHTRSSWFPSARWISFFKLRTIQHLVLRGNGSEEIQTFICINVATIFLEFFFWSLENSPLKQGQIWTFCCNSGTYRKPYQHLSKINKYVKNIYP